MGRNKIRLKLEGNKRGLKLGSPNIIGARNSKASFLPCPLFVSRNQPLVVSVIGDKHECGESRMDDPRNPRKWNFINSLPPENDWTRSRPIPVSRLITNLFVRFHRCSRVYRFIAPLILPTRGPISRPISDLSSSVCACVNNGQFRSIRVISFHPPLTLFHLLTVMGIVFHTLTDPTDSRSRRKRPADSDPSPPWPTLS